MKKSGRPKKWKNEEKELWKLRGEKLKYLRSHWGFSSRNKLINDTRWESIVRLGSTLCNDNGLGKYERGERPLFIEELQKIAKAFYIPLYLLEDEVAMDDFKNAAQQIFINEHKKQSNGVTLSRTQYFLADNDIFVSLKNRVMEWEKSQYSYVFIRKHSNAFKIYTDKDNILFDDQNNKAILAFLLIVSIYCKTDWKKWTLKNTDNSIALNALLEIFKSNHYRTRFRALYSMQKFKHENILDCLKTYKEIIDKNNYHIVEKYVLNNSVIDFIKYCSISDNQHISRRAQEVLSEIAIIWNEKGIENEIQF